MRNKIKKFFLNFFLFHNDFEKYMNFSLEISQYCNKIQFAIRNMAKNPRNDFTRKKHTSL